MPPGMLRFLLSLLALVSGLAVPGMADARVFGPCGTQIGAAAELNAEAQASTAQIGAQPGQRPAQSLQSLVPALAYTPASVTAAPTVLIGSDRARQ